MPTDWLSAVQPTRLHRQQGVWVLDVQRFVSLGQGVLRPTVEQLQGEAVITHYFAQHPGDHSLGPTARQLMRDGSGDTRQIATAFEVMGSRWIPIAAAEIHTTAVADAPVSGSAGTMRPSEVADKLTASAPTEPGRSATTPVADLDAIVRALGALRISHNKLQARVDELETRLATGGARTSPTTSTTAPGAAAGAAAAALAAPPSDATIVTPPPGAPRMTLPVPGRR